MEKTQAGSVGKPRPHVIPKQRTDETDSSANRTVWISNGRVVSKTLADPDVQKKLKADQLKKYPNREAFIKEMHRRGVLTRTGKLKENYGG